MCIANYRGEKAEAEANQVTIRDMVANTVASRKRKREEKERLRDLEFRARQTQIQEEKLRHLLRVQKVRQRDGMALQGITEKIQTAQNRLNELLAAMDKSESLEDCPNKSLPNLPTSAPRMSISPVRKDERTGSASSGGQGRSPPHLPSPETRKKMKAASAKPGKQPAPGRSSVSSGFLPSLPGQGHARLPNKRAFKPISNPFG